MMKLSREAVLEIKSGTASFTLLYNEQINETKEERIDRLFARFYRFDGSLYRAGGTFFFHAGEN
ncbi:hypothetical protein BACCOPRO_03204 [Phocaeicola coprophilus DSM 18228 = JCM 13818]|uniref:Uncharacterized protein n=1 Tax=Phocaeicola coprophilus DSM 18228 = JCM 13818 TaxID=547042 RepID=S0FCU3_9BACT|nr:hypothetical protein BACCOPRO_03204 [Phocaeicola coprophilus DSM 18228 = JCM 13818]